MRKKHYAQGWEVSISELINSVGKVYKVTRRIPEFKVAETKMFRSKEDAKALFDEWLK